MTKNPAHYYFEIKDNQIVFDPFKSILSCRTNEESSKKIWAKKILDNLYVDSVIEDGERYYVACIDEDEGGQLLALDKKTGITIWYIPGKSFLQIIFKGYLYLIFIDPRHDYFLLKVNPENGSTIWHHQVAEDLEEYRFSSSRVTLIFRSGEVRDLDTYTGEKL